MTEETKHEKFIRLRDKRLPVAQQAFKVLRNLAGPNYEYSSSEAENLVELMQAEVDALAQGFIITGRVPSPPEIQNLEPTPEPEPEERVLAQNHGPYSRGWAAWALDKLYSGDTTSAKEFLKNALAGEKY